MSTPVGLRRGILGGAILITGCLLLASCSSGSNSASSSPLSGRAPAASAARALPVNGPAISAAGAASSGRQATRTAALTPISQSIIYTANLTIQAKDVAAAARQAVSIAEATGGYVAGEQESGGGSGGRRPAVTLTLKIPVAAYNDALAQLSSSSIGKQLTLQRQATDVTAQVADVNSLVTSQEDAIAALQGLLKKAGSVSGLLQVQQQISYDESNLNSLQAQQRALSDETSYATVTMNLVSPKKKAPAHHKAATRHGFLAGLAAGWRALRHATGSVLTAFGAALPFLAVLALLAAGYLGWRRFGRNRPRPTPAA